MNSTQKAYMTAKTAYEIMIAEKTARLTPFAHLLDSDSGIEEYTDIEITVSDELKSDELYTALRAADSARPSCLPPRGPVLAPRLRPSA